jgi:hypothetical protein
MISNITESTYLGSNWVLHKQTINLINGSVTPPRLAQVTQYYRDTANVVWDFSSRSVYNYTNNLLSDIQTSNYDTVTNVWRNAGLVSYSYNANNQLTEEVKQVYNLNSSNFENDQRKLLTYNATNLNDKTTFYDNAGPAAWIESGRDNFYYNSNDSLIHLLNEEYIGSSFVPNYQYFYHYADVPVGIHEVNNLFTNATLYPNPCSNVLTIDTKDEIPKTVQAVIYSLNGKKVWSQISTTPDHKLLFDVASLPNGNFVLQLSDLKSSKRHHFKFTKK